MAQDAEERSPRARRAHRRRSHWRCQRTTVSGSTKIRAARQSRHALTVRQARPDRVVFAIDTMERPLGRYVMRIAATSASRGDTVQRHVPFDVIVQ